MSLWHAMLLGVLQGITEFLPISSSGHLIILQHLLGYTESLLIFDVLLHLATLVAILGYFNVRLIPLIRKHWLFVSIATIPAVLAGLFFEPIFEQFFGSLLTVSLGLLVTALLLFLSHKIRLNPINNSLYRSLWVGMFQALAIIPGISRSGSTISAAHLVGVDFDEAFDLSFLMSIPVILGALVLQLRSVTSEQLVFESTWLAGMITAAIAGLLALKLLRVVLVKERLHYFSVYCLSLAGILLIFMR